MIPLKATEEREEEREEREEPEELLIHHPGDGSKQSPAVRRRKEEPSVEGGEGEELKG